MAYNLHPIFVHFPIALLFLYSVIKILPVRRFWPKVAWLDIERVLLSVGVVMALVAAYTGGLAERLVHPNHQLVEAHSTFAGISIWLYGLLLLGEGITMFSSRFFKRFRWLVIEKIVKAVGTILNQPIISRLLALAALIALSVAGLLGGVIVYGLSADPLAGFVLNLLGIVL